MTIQTTRRHVLFAALLATFLLSAVSAMAQERKLSTDELALPIKGNCPNPIAVTLTATTPNVLNADFTPAMLAAPRAFLNDPAPNKVFMHTFTWKRPQRCCEITRAVLTVKFKANQGGQSNTSSDAGNDGVALMHLGSVVPGFSGSIYSSWPFNAGQTATRTFNLTGAALNFLNTTDTASVYSQDDSAVVSVTLQLWGCCLTTPRASSVEEAQPQR
ncbi:MAG: hypothetical protein QOD75_1765 [Blastocatellia bacterium]|nr:hypothetical protein [Blastocatellia bacterium]